MVLAGKHSIDIRTSGRVFARTAHQHSRFRATTLPSTSWQTLWQHSNSSLWHCHTDFHAGYQHKWHNAITVLCSKYHFNIGWTNITLNIAKKYVNTRYIAQTSAWYWSHSSCSGFLPTTNWNLLPLMSPALSSSSINVIVFNVIFNHQMQSYRPLSISDSTIDVIISSLILLVHPCQYLSSMPGDHSHTIRAIWPLTWHWKPIKGTRVQLLYPISLRLDRRLGHETASITLKGISTL